MAPAFEEMRGRFRLLDTDTRAVLQALKLLDQAGALATHSRLTAVLAHGGLFQRAPTDLSDCLDRLVQWSLLKSPSRPHVISLEVAFLSDDVVSYPEGRTPEDGFSVLAEVLAALQNAEGLLSLGVAFTLRNDHENALSCFEQAVHHRPGFAVAWIGRGDALTEIGQYSEALLAYNEGLEIDPAQPEAWVKKGWLLQENLGLPHKAIYAYNQAILHHHVRGSVWINKATALQSLGHHRLALASLQNAARIDPKV